MIESSLRVRDDLVADSVRYSAAWPAARRRLGRLGVDATRGADELPAVRTSAYGGRCLDRGVMPPGGGPWSGLPFLP